MAFREVGVAEVKEVLRLSRDGVSKKRIARQLGLDVKTVKRYLERAEGIVDLDAAVVAVVERLAAHSGRPRGEGWERRQGQRDWIASHLGHGVRLTKVRRLLKRRWVQVSYAWSRCSRSTA